MNSRNTVKSKLYDEHGINFVVAITLLKSKSITIIISSLVVTMIFLLGMYKLMPNYQSSFLMTPGSFKYITKNKIMTDFFFSAKDLQIYLQHEFENREKLPDGIKIGENLVIKDSNEILKMTIYGKTKESIADFVKEVTDKFLAFNSNEIERFKNMKLKKQQENVIYNDPFSKGAIIEFEKNHLIDGVKTRTFKYMRMSVYLKAFVFLFITLIVVFSALFLFFKVCFN